MSIKTITGSFPWQTDAPLSWPITTEVGPGLSGVIACETRVSWLDPLAGLLLYRGVPVERLAGVVSFEDVSYLLITGKQPAADPADFARFAERLRASRALPQDVIDLVRSIDPEVDPSRILRAGISAMGCHELSVTDEISGARHWRELRIVGQVVALVAEIGRHRQGLPSLAIDPTCKRTPASASSLRRHFPRPVGHAQRPQAAKSKGWIGELPRVRRNSDEDAQPSRRPPNEGARCACSRCCSLAHGMLHALTDQVPSDEEVRLLDTLWVLYADHGLDAPSFTSMIVASCHADPYYNIVAGLSALNGPRLSVTEAVLEQLLPLTDEASAERWVQDHLRAGKTIAGFGHRMYRMDDPRVVVLRRELAIAARRRGRGELFAIARTVEREASMVLAPKGVHVNINFYAAPLFHLLGADQAALIPCLYAVGRMAGLVARVQEALETGRLYRPLSNYVGVEPRRLK